MFGNYSFFVEYLSGAGMYWWCRQAEVNKSGMIPVYKKLGL